MLALDIETIPTVAALALPYPEAERKAPGSMSKAETIAAWRDGDREKWQVERIKEYSLNPRFGRVVSVGMANGPTLPESWAEIAQTEADEAGAIARAWELVVDWGQIVTFNGLSFDLPFLVTRSILLGLTPPLNVADYLRRYSTAKHLDCRAVLNNWDSYAKGTMNDWCRALGLADKVGDGGDVWGMVQEEEWEALTEYSRWDASLTYQMGQRVGPWYGVV